MDTVCVIALVVGAVGLGGGFVWGWVATRTAARVAFKIVAGVSDMPAANSRLDARITALEAWRLELAGASAARPQAAQPNGPASHPAAGTS